MFTLRDFSLEEVNSRPLRIGSLLHLNGRPRTDARGLLFKCNGELSPEAEERSAPALDQRDRFTRDDIRLGGLGKREAKVLRGKPR